MSYKRDYDAEPEVKHQLRNVASSDDVRYCYSDRDPIYIPSPTSKVDSIMPKKMDNQKRLIEKWNKAAKDYCDKAKTSIISGCQDLEEIYYKSALFLNPESYDGLCGYGEYFLQKEEFNNACICFGKAIDIDNKKEDAVVGKTKALILLDKPNDAMALLNMYLDSNDSTTCTSLKESLLSNGIKDAEAINKAKAAIDDEYEQIIDENNYVSFDEETTELINQNNSFIDSLYDFCFKRYLPLGEDVFCAQSIIITFYSSISALHYSFEDYERFIDEGSFDYLYNRFDLENIDSHTEKLIGVHKDENRSEQIRCLIEPLICEAKKRIKSLSAEDKKDLLIYSMNKASEIGFYVYANIETNENDEYSSKNNDGIPDEQLTLNDMSDSRKNETTDYNGLFPKADKTKLDDSFIIEDGVLKSYKGKESILTIPNGIRIIGHGAFSYNSTVERIQFPESLIEIEYEAFYSCRNLKYVDLPHSLEKIGSHAFKGSSIEKIIIPENVKSIKYNAFEECKNLVVLSVAENNKYYKSINNCVITSDGLMTVCLCAASVVPDGLIDSSKFEKYYWSNQRYSDGRMDCCLYNYKRYFDSMLPIYTEGIDSNKLDKFSYKAVFEGFKIPSIMVLKDHIDMKKAIEFTYRMSYEEIDQSNFYFDVNWTSEDVEKIKWSDFLNAFALFAVFDDPVTIRTSRNALYWGAFIQPLGILINNRPVFNKVISSVTNNNDDAYMHFKAAVSIIMHNRICRYIEESKCAYAYYYLSEYRPFMIVDDYKRAEEKCCKLFDVISRARIDKAVKENYSLSDLFDFSIEKFFFYNNYFSLDYCNEKTKSYICNKLKDFFEKNGDFYKNQNPLNAKEIYCKAIHYIEDEEIKDFFRRKAQAITNMNT